MITVKNINTGDMRDELDSYKLEPDEVRVYPYIEYKTEVGFEQLIARKIFSTVPVSKKTTMTLAEIEQIETDSTYVVLADLYRADYETRKPVERTDKQILMEDHSKTEPQADDIVKLKATLKLSSIEDALYIQSKIEAQAATVKSTTTTK